MLLHIKQNLTPTKQHNEAIYHVMVSAKFRTRTIIIVMIGSVIERLKRRACDKHDLGSKLTIIKTSILRKKNKTSEKFQMLFTKRKISTNNCNMLTKIAFVESAFLTKKYIFF